MAPRKLFGSLYLDGNVGPGENPNGVVMQDANGTNINGRGSDGDNDWAYGLTADGPRWNKPTPGGMFDNVPRPVAVVARRRK